MFSLCAFLIASNGSAVRQYADVPLLALSIPTLVPLIDALKLKRPRKNRGLYYCRGRRPRRPAKKPHELPWLDLLVIILKNLEFTASLVQREVSALADGGIGKEKPRLSPWLDLLVIILENLELLGSFVQRCPLWVCLALSSCGAGEGLKKTKP